MSYIFYEQTVYVRVNLLFGSNTNMQQKYSKKLPYKNEFSEKPLQISRKQNLSCKRLGRVIKKERISVVSIV
jgi:hypothetical protein